MKILNYFKGGVIGWSVWARYELRVRRPFCCFRDCSGKLKVFHPEMRPHTTRSLPSIQAALCHVTYLGQEDEQQHGRRSHVNENELRGKHDI